MKRIRKGITALVLMLTLVMAILPANASTTSIVRQESLNLGDDSWVAESNSNDAEGWSWDKGSRTLTLRSIDFSTEGPAILLPGDSTVVLVNGTENKIHAKGSSIYAYGDCTIRGGSLTITGDNVGIYGKSILLDVCTIHITNEKYISDSGMLQIPTYFISAESLTLKSSTLIGSVGQEGINCSTLKAVDSVIEMENTIASSIFAEDASFQNSRLQLRNCALMMLTQCTFDGCTVSLQNINTGLRTYGAQFVSCILDISATGEISELDGIGVVGVHGAKVEFLRCSGTVAGKYAAFYVEGPVGSMPLVLEQTPILSGGALTTVPSMAGFNPMETPLVALGTVAPEGSDISFTDLHPRGCATEVQFGLPFTDVPIGQWYYGYVAKAFDMGLVNGVSKTSFAPNRNTTRAMLVTLLYRMEGSPAPTGQAPLFSDLDPNAYYIDAVAWASVHGIINGVTTDRFAPNCAVTREQLSAMLYRYAEYKGFDVSEVGNLSLYADQNLISPYARRAMAWANGTGLLQGVSAELLRPQGAATRAQVATILVRLADYYTA